MNTDLQLFLYLDNNSSFVLVMKIFFLFSFFNINNAYGLSKHVCIKLPGFYLHNGECAVVQRLISKASVKLFFSSLYASFVIITVHIFPS